MLSVITMAHLLRRLHTAATTTATATTWIPYDRSMDNTKFIITETWQKLFGDYICWNPDQREVQIYRPGNTAPIATVGIVCPNSTVNSTITTVGRLFRIIQINETIIVYNRITKMYWIRHLMSHSKMYFLDADIPTDIVTNRVNRPMMIEARYVGHGSYEARNHWVIRVHDSAFELMVATVELGMIDHIVDLKGDILITCNSFYRKLPSCAILRARGGNSSTFFNVHMKEPMRFDISTESNTVTIKVFDNTPVDVITRDPQTNAILLVRSEPRKEAGPLLATLSMNMVTREVSITGKIPAGTTIKN